MEKVLNKNK